MHIDTFVVAL